MFVIPAIVIAIVYLVLKILVPTILIIALVALVCIYYRNRGEGEGEGIEQQLNVENVKEKATTAWEKAKLFLNWFTSKNKKNDNKEQELADI